VDIDGDGHVDILSGSYSRMDNDMAGLFQVLYGNPDGTFRKAEVLKGTDGRPLIIPGTREEALTEKICTRPFAVDFDGDGKLDLVVGNFSGTFYWFKGEGKGKFDPKPQQIMCDGKPLKIPGNHSDPCVIDFDGDGALDIVSGSSDGGVYWARNRAGKGQPPEFGPFEPLIPPAPPAEDGQLLSEKDLTRPTHAARVWVADVNGDGKLDLLVGDMVTLASPAKGISPEECKAKYAEWKAAFEAASAAMQKAGGEKAQAKAREEYQKVYSSRKAFLHEEMTGFVWLYLQK